MWFLFGVGVRVGVWSRPIEITTCAVFVPWFTARIGDAKPCGVRARRILAVRGGRGGLRHGGCTGCQYSLSDKVEGRASAAKLGGQILGVLRQHLIALGSTGPAFNAWIARQR